MKARVLRTNKIVEVEYLGKLGLFTKIFRDIQSGIEYTDGDIVFCSDLNSSEQNMIGTFKWQTGTPTEYGSYLVLHLDSYNQRVINHDIWFDNSGRWQSNWHNIIAWCKFSDIKIHKTI